MGEPVITLCDECIDDYQDAAFIKTITYASLAECKTCGEFKLCFHVAGDLLRLRGAAKPIQGTKTNHDGLLEKCPICGAELGKSKTHLNCYFCGWSNPL